MDERCVRKYRWLEREQRDRITPARSPNSQLREVKITGPNSTAKAIIGMRVQKEAAR